MTINCMSGTIFEEVEKVKSELVDFMKLHSKRICEWQEGTIKKEEYKHHRLWEYAMAIAFTNPQSGQRILDAGGANSVLSWFLASKGIHVVSNDLNKRNVANAAKNNKYFGFPNIEYRIENICEMVPSGHFDYVYNICVIEHVMEHFRLDREKSRPTDFWNKYEPPQEEWAIESRFVKSLASQVKPGGLLVISFAYATKQGNIGGNSCHVCAYMRSPEDVLKRIVEPSKFSIYGGDLDMSLVSRQHPIGIIFLRP